MLFFVFTQFFCLVDNKKLKIVIGKPGFSPEIQLFNLEEDPGQKENLAQKYPELMDKLKKKLLKINTSVMSEGEDWHLK